MHLRIFMAIMLVLTFLGIRISVEGKEKWAPDFIIVGAMKSGTGALRSFIMQHPLILAPEDKSEVHFFDLNFEKGPKWYKEQFPERPSPDYLVGEKSPYYIVHPLVPKRMFSLYPKVKVIMILRNPVDRAYSHYQFNRNRDKESLSFEEAIKAESSRLAEEEKKLKQNPLYHSSAYKAYSYLTRGVYVDQIQRWLSYFPSEQILVLSLDDLKVDSKRVTDEVFAFLGLPEYEINPQFDKKKSNYAPMSPETRKKLIKYFQPYNQQLEELLNREFHWDN